MALPSLTVIACAVFVAYLSHSMYTMVNIFYPKLCADGERCIHPYLRKNPMLDLYVFSSVASSVTSERGLKQLYFKSHFNVTTEDDSEVVVKLPDSTRNNGSLFVHIFVVPSGKRAFHEQSVYAKSKITTFAVPAAQTMNLISSSQDETISTDDQHTPISHLRSKLSFSIMTDDASFNIKNVPVEIIKYIKITENNKYLPILYVDELSYRTRDLVAINSSITELPLTIHYQPISIGKLRLWTNFQESLKMLEGLGFTEKDTDEVKGIFSDTNFYFLMLTFIVAAFHLLFDFLAFKNDISYWKNRNDMVGLSTRVILWRCISTFIIFLYLLDENTSLLVLIPAGIGSLIELWKVTIAFKISINWSGKFPKLQFGLSSEKELETANFDSEAMRYLSWVMWPLVVIGAVYSLYYVPHRSWYSWVINSLVNGIYAFGFLFMLPQLFLNYKLKSVAHLPWRAFMYKAFNTFIDDVFAFIITMPTAHRLACFRDDVVFVIYLYQRWLYPVDKSRVNEYGQSFDEKQQQNQEDKKTK